MPVQLRSLRPDDAIISTAWRNDPDIRDNILGYQEPVSEAMERKWIEKTIAEHGIKRIVYAIDDTVDEKLVGYVYLDDIDWPNHSAWVGILIGDKSRQRRGYGKTAVTKIAAIAKETYGIRKLSAKVVEYNKASQTFFKALGFECEPTASEQQIYMNKNQNIHVFSLNL